MNQWTALPWALAFLLLCQVLGRALYCAMVLSKPRRDSSSVDVLPSLLRLFFEHTLGLGLCLVLLFFAALVGLFTPIGLAAIFGLALFFAAVVMQRHRSLKIMQPPAPRMTPVVEGVALAALLAGLLMAAWRVPGHWDDTSYHLAMARTFVTHQGLAVNEFLRFPYFPAYMQLLFALALLVSGDVLAQWMATLPVFLTVLGLMGFSRWQLGSSAWGAGAGALYVLAPSVAATLGYAYVDYGLALFCTAALWSLAVWWSSGGHRSHARWLVLAGLFAGVAGGIKLLGLVFAVLLGVAVLLMARRWRPVLGYGALCTLVCGGWYLRSYILTGDPVHPAGGAIFGYYLWDAADLALQQAEQSRHGLPKVWVNFFPAFQHIGVAYVWPAFALPIFLQRLPRLWWLLWGVMCAFSLFWFYVSQVDRYLVPVLALACLLSVVCVRCVAYAMASILPFGTLSVLRPLGKALESAVLLTAGIGFAVMGWNNLMGRPSLQRQLAMRPEIVLLQKAEAVASQYGNKVFNIGYENSFYYYSGQLMGDWFGLARYSKYSECVVDCRLNSRENIVLEMDLFGADLLLINRKMFEFNPIEYDGEFKLVMKVDQGYLYARNPKKSSR